MESGDKQTISNVGNLAEGQSFSWPINISNNSNESRTYRIYLIQNQDNATIKLKGADLGLTNSYVTYTVPPNDWVKESGLLPRLLISPSVDKNIKIYRDIKLFITPDCTDTKAEDYDQFPEQILTINFEVGTRTLADDDCDGMLNGVDNCPTLATSGINFDGVDDQVEIWNNYAIDFGAKDNFTIECWVNIPDTPQIDKGNNLVSSILESWDESLQKSPYTIRYRTDTKTIFAMRNDGPMSSFVFTHTKVNDGKWHHIAFVKDDNELRLLIDGKIDGIGEDFSTINTPHNSLFLGQRRDNVLNLKGGIDELRFWNTSRTEADIDKNRFKEMSATEPGLVAYYKLEGLVRGDNSTTKAVNDLLNTSSYGWMTNFDLTGDSSNYVVGAKVRFADLNFNSIGDQCEATATNDVNKTDLQRFVILPNPASSHIMLEYLLYESTDVNIELYDMLGSIQYKSFQNKLTSGIQQKQIDIQHLLPGMYNVIIKTGKTILSKKLIVAH
ncbi:MAG: T9SS type A sorting domain-containing protein [Saprospiraceae bacterium]|nr:T9SS type A sorting domain-containing protein [Saprospiraceae bacterium]